MPREDMVFHTVISLISVGFLNSACLIDSAGLVASTVMRIRLV